MNNDNIDWKFVLLSRWAGEYPPARLDEDHILKSSQEIADDLRGAGDFTADEVSMFLAIQGYRVVFENGYPFWAVKNESLHNLIED